MASKYEVRVPTNDGWKVLETRTDREAAEVVARECAVYQQNGYFLIGTRVDEVWPGELGRGWRSFNRRLVCVYDDQGERHTTPLKSWASYEHDLEARGWPAW